MDLLTLDISFEVVYVDKLFSTATALNRRQIAVVYELSHAGYRTSQIYGGRLKIIQALDRHMVSRSPIVLDHDTDKIVHARNSDCSGLCHD